MAVPFGGLETSGVDLMLSLEQTIDALPAIAEAAEEARITAQVEFDARRAV